MSAIRRSVPVNGADINYLFNVLIYIYIKKEHFTDLDLSAFLNFTSL